MAKPFDDGSPSEPHSQEHIPREVQSNLANCTAISSAQYPPLPLSHAHSFRNQGEYCNHSAPTPGCRGQLTCGRNTANDSPLPGGSRQTQPTVSDEAMGAPLTTRDRDAHQETGDDEAIIRQIGIQLRQMADQLHTHHMERMVDWDRRRWPVWYWTFLNFFMHTMAIFRMPRWR